MISDKALKRMIIGSLIVLGVLVPLWYFQDRLWGSTTQLVWFNMPPCKYDANGVILPGGPCCGDCYNHGWGTYCGYRLVHHRFPFPDYTNYQSLIFDGNVTCPRFDT